MTKKEKIAFVCQRYGLDVSGGAEAYCRQIAEKLSDLYDVTVYTTCARDHIRWSNEYRPGNEIINEVHVKRYPSDQERDLSKFDEINKIVWLLPDHSDEQEERFIKEQGPYCPKLIDAVQKEQNQYKAIFFVTYLYYTTVEGLLRKIKRAILIPTLHDEQSVYLRIYDKALVEAQGFVWNTLEEKEFAENRFPSIKNRLGAITGIGITGPEKELPVLPAELRDSEYVVYAGRIEKGKGCDEMLAWFLKYKRRNEKKLKLVLIGKAITEIPDDPDILSLGFVSEEMKFAIMQQAKALLLFSRYESLSIVVLESMFMGTPVLVNGHCEVLKGHCVHSNAGLYFTNYLEFEATLNYILEHPDESKMMGENGLKYVKAHYQWDVIINKYRDLIEKLK